MAKPKSKAFEASKSLRPAPKGGKAVAATEFIKTTIILNRKEGGGAAAADVDKIYDIGGDLGKYATTSGWDPCSGLGSPRGDKLLALLG